MALEILVPRSRSIADESLASFVRRRLGAEVLDKIAAPLMAGIHAADPERLSLQSTFPMFADMEKSHGSIALGIARRKQHTTHSSAKESSAKPSSMFTSLSGGLQQLTDTIADQLDSSCIRLNCRVTSLTRESGRYEIALSDGSSISADNIVLTTPAYATADIVQRIDPFLAAALRGIRYVTTATVSLGFKRSDLTCSLNGYGFIVPASEGRRISACSWSSTKFAGRAPDDCVLMRVFIGGALTEDLAEQDEASLIYLARQELREILGITATPVLAKAFRWHKAIPQYDVGHRSHIAAIEHRVAAYPGLYIAGAAYHGAGIPDCVQSGMNTALKIVTAQDRAECIRAEALLPTSSTWENAHAVH
jgi:oxygen-dependent protoporphyrinogen oxidase